MLFISNKVTVYTCTSKLKWHYFILVVCIVCIHNCTIFLLVGQLLVLEHARAKSRELGVSWQRQVFRPTLRQSVDLVIP